MSRRSVMKHQFSQVPTVSVQRSAFNRTHGYKTTFDSGFLVPFYVDEVLPGDTFQVRATLFARLLSALQVPVMDNMFMDTHFFFVPNRLIWDNFQKFMGEQENPEDSTDYLVPQFEYQYGTEADFAHTLVDYFGLPFNDFQEGPNNVNALPFRAYNLIWNEWFRDENLQDSVPVHKGDGPDDNPADYALLRRGKRHDYFTSALPWPQKGPSVEVPLGTTAPVVPDPDDPIPTFSSGSAPTAATINWVPANSNVTWSTKPITDGPAEFRHSGLHVDLSSATAVDINSLRLSVQMQRFLEKDARGGTRYTEILRNHFGVISPDARLQRPEYLGGNSVPISVSTVPQTSAAGGQPTPQGNLAAFGLASSPRNSFSKSFVEHGIIIGLVSVRADLTYQQGIPKMFLRNTKHDYYWPVFSHLGEQAILNKEIYFDMANLANNDKVFGYQERYAEYRYYPSKITGKLRSSDPQTLDIWHLSQNFENLPLLNSEFIEERPPIKRILAVTSEPDFVLDCYIQNKTVRPMPVYSVPGLMDHF